MPFTIDITHSTNLTYASQMIIDRREIVFLFPSKGMDKDDAYDCAQFRSAFMDILQEHDIAKGTTHSPHLPGTNEHITSQHTSSYDIEDLHYHMSFAEDVDFNTVKNLFARFETAANIDPRVDLFMSPSARIGILHAVEGYFNALQNDAEAKQIEQDFRKEKEVELKRLQNAEQLKSIPEIKQQTPPQTLTSSIPSTSQTKAKEEGGFYGLFAQRMKAQQAKPNKPTIAPEQAKPTQSVPTQPPVFEDDFQEALTKLLLSSMKLGVMLMALGGEDEDQTNTSTQSPLRATGP